MQQRYRIADGIGFCRFEGRTIILDITADRYWQLGEDAGRVLEAVGTGMPDRSFGTYRSILLAADDPANSANTTGDCYVRTSPERVNLLNLAVSFGRGCNVCA